VVPFAGTVRSSTSRGDAASTDVSTARSVSLRPSYWRALRSAVDLPGRAEQRWHVRVVATCQPSGYHLCSLRVCIVRVVRKTHALVQVAIALLDDPNGKHWGYELSKQAGVRSGVMYPMLTRMLTQGWLTDGWEDEATIREKRPARRYYELTDEGRLQLGAILQEAESDVRFRGLNWRFA